MGSTWLGSCEHRRANPTSEGIQDADIRDKKHLIDLMWRGWTIMANRITRVTAVHLATMIYSMQEESNNLDYLH